MNVLAIGDIIGDSGLRKVRQELPNIIKENSIDFVIANGENTADGMGINKKTYRELLDCNIDVITLGNHTWAKKDVFQFIENNEIVRPANYPSGVPGKGYRIYKCKDKKIAIINLIGRVSIDILSENPFLEVDKIIEKIKSEIDIIIVDFHAEATAEKIAMGIYLDGKASVVFGTHTHVQTSDEQILENGTGYITDLGMTGPKGSIIGMQSDVALKRFLTTVPERYKVSDNDASFCGCIFSIDDESCKTIKIKRINM